MLDQNDSEKQTFLIVGEQNDRTFLHQTQQFKYEHSAIIFMFDIDHGRGGLFPSESRVHKMEPMIVAGDK